MLKSIRISRNGQFSHFITSILKKGPNLQRSNRNLENNPQFSDLKNKKTEFKTIVKGNLGFLSRKEPASESWTHVLCTNSVHVTEPEPCWCEKDSSIQEKAKK